MDISEFSKIEAGQDELPCWMWSRQATGALGGFKVFLGVLDDDDKDPPDQEMLRNAEELVKFCKAQSDQIVALVYGSYLSAVKSDPDWVELSEVPLNIGREEVMKYLGTNALMVDRDRTGTVMYTQKISLSPYWDDEHGLTLDVSNGVITHVNDSEYRLEQGFLVLSDS